MIENEVKRVTDLPVPDGMSPLHVIEARARMRVHIGALADQLGIGEAYCFKRYNEQFQEAWREIVADVADLPTLYANQIVEMLRG